MLARELTTATWCPLMLLEQLGRLTLVTILHWFILLFSMYIYILYFYFLQSSVLNRSHHMPSGPATPLPHAAMETPRLAPKVYAYTHTLLCITILHDWPQTLETGSHPPVSIPEGHPPLSVSYVEICEENWSCFGQIEKENNCIEIRINLQNNRIQRARKSRIPHPFQSWNQKWTKITVILPILVFSPKKKKSSNYFHLPHNYFYFSIPAL